MLPRAAVLLLTVTIAAASCTSAPPEAVSRGAGPAPEPAAPSGPVQIVVWSSRPLPDALTPAAQRIDGVLAVGSRRSGIADLRATPGASRPVTARPRGAVVPVAVTAVDAAVLAAFPDQREAAAALGRGDALVTRESAAYRGLEPGDAVELGSGDRSVRLRVGAIVDDGRFSRAEIVLPPPAAQRLGIGGRPSLLLAVEAAAAPAAEEALQRAIGTFPARIRSSLPRPPAATEPRAPAGPSRRILSLLELKRHFGEFWYRRGSGRRITVDPAWSGANIVDARVPVLGVVRCHRRIVPLVAGAMAEIQAAGLAGLVRSYDGCYNSRMQVSDDQVISRHAYGVAIDINARTNGYGATPTMDMRIVDIMERWGFVWGGRWTVPDGMHFEFNRFPEHAAP